MQLASPPDAIDVALTGRLGDFSLDVAFTAPMRGITALFGPSGCGKTSVLRAIAGLHHLPGRVKVGGETWQDEAVFRPPHRREVGYVFQEPSLFPHLSVRGNLLYGARRAARSAAPAVDFDEVTRLLGLGALLDRRTAKLSGGERQRVSLGRALLSRPRLLLMDEPLSALDRMAKDEILPYLENLHSGLSLPILYVSHDIAEIERLADRIVVLDKGALVAEGPLNETLTNTAFGFLRRPGFASVVEARVAGFDPFDGLIELDLCGQKVFVAGAYAAAGETMRLRIAASDVSLAREEPVASTILNILRARVERLERVGEAQVNVVLGLDGAGSQRFVAQVTRRSLRRLGIEAGEEVFAQVKSVSLATARGGKGG